MLKRGQGWGVDLIIGGVIILAGIIAFYGYTFNLDTEKKSIIDELQNEGDSIATVLLDEGVPSDWTPTQVTRPGILSRGKINQTKLEYLNDLSLANYGSLKQTLRIKHEFMINLSEPLIIHGTQVPAIGRTAENATNSMKESRVVVYNNKPTTLWIITWE